MQIDKPILIYFAKGFALYILYYLIYQNWIAPDGRVDTWLNEFIAFLGNKTLQLIGYESCRTGAVVCIRGVSTIFVGNGCNGLEIYCIFAAFIVLSQGWWIFKITYIVFGIIIVFLSNVIRVVLLSIDHYNNLKLFFFNHKYTYVFLVYAIVFGLWILWITKFANRRGLSKN